MVFSKASGEFSKKGTFIDAIKREDVALLSNESKSDLKARFLNLLMSFFISLKQVEMFFMPWPGSRQIKRSLPEYLWRLSVSSPSGLIKM